MSEELDTQKQLFKIIENVLGQPKDQRAAWLKQHCAADQLDAASRLLSAAEAATLGVTDFDVSQFYTTGEAQLGHLIGAYRLTELIGEGGMGLVYLAQRDDGAFEHQVAIKVIRLAISDPSLVRRFEQERQILSNLHHPNIAMLHDGGTTEQGVPYLVMEYVNGTPIDLYIRQNNLDTGQILGLFVKISSAVHAAHQALIIHRDIKPANLLVDQKGEPKLLDFGIARSLDPVANKNREKTQLARLTPSYASPEQIREESLTTATDVYSLGVVLYEALTNKLPYEVTGLSSLEAERLITNTAAQRPSLQMINKRSPRASLRRSELDAIVLKALSTDPNRRYDSAGALMDDLKRYLKGLPVEARLDTALYRLQKFVTRHLAASLATAAALLALIGGLSASLIQTQKANEQLARAEAVGTYLQKLLLAPQPSVNSPTQLGPDAKVTDLLTAAELTLDDDLLDQPDVKIELYNTIGTAQMWMNNMDAALRNTRKAVTLASDKETNNDDALIDAVHALATVLDDDEQFEEAITTYRRALTLADAQGPSGHDMQITIRNDLAVALANSNEWKLALVIQREAVDRVAKKDYENINFIVAPLANLGIILFENGLVKEAEENLRRAIKLAESDSTSSYFQLRSRQRLARLLDFTGRFSEALEEYQLCLQNNKQHHVDAAGDSADVQLRMARIFIRNSQIDDAKKILDELAVEFEDQLDSTEAWIFFQVLSAYQYSQSDFQGSLAAAQKARRQLLLDNSPYSELIIIDHDIARAQLALNQHQEARENFTLAYQRAVNVLGLESFHAKAIEKDLLQLSKNVGTP